MSHIVTIKAEVKDENAIRAACARLHLAAPKHGKAEIYNTPRSGVIVQLPEWTFPIVIDTATGDVHYDNYNGYWGDIRHLNAFRQAYTAEKARIEAKQHGHRYSEQTLPNGSIQVTVTTRG